MNLQTAILLLLVAAAILLALRSLLRKKGCGGGCGSCPQGSCPARKDCHKPRPRPPHPGPKR